MKGPNPDDVARIFKGGPTATEAAANMSNALRPDDEIRLERAGDPIDEENALAEASRSFAPANRPGWIDAHRAKQIIRDAIKAAAEVSEAPYPEAVCDAVAAAFESVDASAADPTVAVLTLIHPDNSVEYVAHLVANDETIQGLYQWAAAQTPQGSRRGRYDLLEAK